MFPGTHLIPSWHNLYQQTDGIPLGLALWNPNRPATRMALGISAGRSGETLFHKGEPIPLGRTPWNLYHSPVFMSPGTRTIPSGHNLYQDTDGIPPGIYIFSRGFVKSSISSQRGWSFFTFDFGL
jgi:hypothetical protein